MSISADNIEPTRVILPLTRLECDRVAAFLDGVPHVSHKQWVEKARVAVRPEDDVLDEIVQRDIDYSQCGFLKDFEP